MTKAWATREASRCPRIDKARWADARLRQAKSRDHFLGEDCHDDTRYRVDRIAFGPAWTVAAGRTGARRSEAAGASGRSVHGRQAWLFLCRRPLCRRLRQEDHGGPDLCRGPGAEESAPPLPVG